MENKILYANGRELFEKFLTVGRLLDFIEKYKIPRDAKVLLQRVEDIYFEKHNWSTVNKEGEFYYQAIETNQKIDSGEFNNKEDYPHLTPEKIEQLRMEGDDLENLKEKYVQSWCPVKYPDDNNLYLDAHY